MCFFPTENKENKESSRIRVSDLIKLPKFDLSTQKAKRKAPASDISRKSLKFIEEADARQKEKDKKEKELDKIKKQAVKQAKQAKAKEKKEKKKPNPRRKAIPLHPRL